MKILHINNKFDWSGGSQTYLIQLIEELEKRNVDNVVIYGESTSGVYKRIPSYFVHNINVFSFFNNRVKINELHRIISKEKPDIIYIHNIDNLAIIEFCSKILPTFVFAHDYRFICPGNGKYFIRQEKICEKNFGFQCLVYPYFKMCNNRRPDRLLKSFGRTLKAKKILENVQIIAASDYVKERFIREGFKPGRIAVVPCFAQVPQNISRNNNSKKILYLGRIAEAKGVSHLLKALALVKSDCRAIITGTGKNLNRLKNLASNLKIEKKVSFVGWVNKKQKNKLLEDCAFVVMPSLWPECFGIAGVEAMSFSKSVIAYNVGGVSDWLKNGENGFLVPHGNYREFAERIDFLLKNPDISLDLGRNGRRMFEQKFTAEKHIEKLLKIFIDSK